MRKSKLLGWALALGVGLGLAQAPGARAEDGVTNDEIVVGAIGALTGALSFVGMPGRDGFFE